VRYEVHIHTFGRPTLKHGPMAGCRGFETHKWVCITERKLRSLDSAKMLADSQTVHAVVVLANSSEKVYDNGRAPGAIL